MSMSFEEYLSWGNKASSWFTKKLVSEGYKVIRLDEFVPTENEMGPRVHTNGSPYVPPDLLALTPDAKMFAADVKRKTEYTLGKISGQPEHGTETRYFEGYKRFEVEWGIPTLIVFIVAEPLTIDAIRVTSPEAESGRNSVGVGKGPMKFWTVDQMSPEWWGLI